MLQQSHIQYVCACQCVSECVLPSTEALINVTIWLCVSGRLGVMDGKNAAANMWDGSKHYYTAITYSHPTIITTAIHTLCKRPQHTKVSSLHTILLFLMFPLRIEKEI